ncbi:MAG: HAD-IA family hydrolase [Verrucomicrobia bacterium]|nr:HAD-IA family hydrolase [Verrucomicrobiota bacterium]
MKLRAVTFDAGGTLLYPHPSVGAIYADTARRHGCVASAEAMEAAFRHVWATSHHAETLGTAGNVSQKTWWRQLVFRALDHIGAVMDDREAYFEELYDTFGHAGVWRLFPDAMDTITAVKARGLKVGLLSNWDNRLRPVLEELGVLALMDGVCISCEVGAEKPHEKIFRAACASVGVKEPSAVLHVGDSYREDILGAQAVGMRAVLIHRGEAHPWRATTIRQLAELLPLLE